MRRKILLISGLVLWVLGSATYAQSGRALMGVEFDGAALPELLTKHLGLDAGQGVRIRNVILGSPADKAALERDDIVFVFQGKKVTGVDQVVEAVHAADVGEEVSLEVIHLGQRKSLKLKLEAAQADGKLKYPPEPEAMTTWRPGKIFKVGPEGKEWMEIPFDKVPEFNLDVNKFFREVRTFHHQTDGEDYTITIEGDPKSEDSTVILEAGDQEYRTTVGKLDAIPEKYRDQVRDAIENSRKETRKDVIIERKFRLPEPPRPETYQKFFRSMPRPDIERFSEQKDRVLERLEEQMNRLQERMESLEQRNRELLDRFLEKKGAKPEKDAAGEKPAASGDDRAI